MKRTIDKMGVIAGSALSTVYGVGGEFLNYVVADDLINHTYNIPLEGLVSIGITGLVSLALSAPAGAVAWQSYKNLRENQ